MKRKFTFVPSKRITRQDLSDPFHNIPYSDRIKNSGVQINPEDCTFVELPNGMFRYDFKTNQPK